MALQTIVIIVIISPAAFFYIKRRQARQLAYIQSYVFHLILGNKVKEKYPHLNNDQINTVFEGLRDYFFFCNQAKKHMVAMPSQGVDVAWHEFILSTRAYE